MQTLLLTILVLGILVFVHELGHFLTAKWAGISVPRFSIGLGPRVLGVRVGETDYCLSAIPFGGYVKMAGMEGEEAFERLEGGAEPVERDPDENVPPERRFENKSRLQRLLVLSAGVGMNFLLGWLIYVGIAAGDGLPAIPGTHVAAVDSVALGRNGSLEGLVGATIQAVEGKPVENWYEINRAIVDARGEAIDFALESGETVEIHAVGPEARREIALALTPLVAPVIDEVDPKSPAGGSGLQEGDRILSVDGVETPTFEAVSEAVRSRPDQLVSIVVDRDGENLSLTVRLGVQKTPRPTDGKFVDTGWLGVAAEIGRIKLGPLEAVAAGSQATWRAGTLIVDGLVQLVSGGVSLRSLGGPVAIGQLTGHFARQGMSSLLAWVALFSINLAILNLLPIPVLDGGHILFLGIEATRGRPLSARQKLRLSQMGLAFLVLLMAWAFTADILRLVGF
jgi:regulator of sigma E protease